MHGKAEVMFGFYWSFSWNASQEIGVAKIIQDMVQGEEKGPARFLAPDSTTFHIDFL